MKGTSFDKKHGQTIYTHQRMAARLDCNTFDRWRAPDMHIQWPYFRWYVFKIKFIAAYHHRSHVWLQQAVDVSCPEVHVPYWQYSCSHMFLYWRSTSSTSASTEAINAAADGNDGTVHHISSLIAHSLIRVGQEDMQVMWLRGPCMHKFSKMSQLQEVQAQFHCIPTWTTIG